MKKKYFLKILVLFIGLFLFNINQVNALSFNEKAEDFWGYWAADKSTTLKNTSSYTYRCEKVSDPNSLVAINNNGGCALTSQDVFTNQDVKIKIIRTSKDGTETSVPKTLKMRANAVRIHAPLRIGDKYNAGADFKRLGLKVYSNSKAFTTIPTSVLKTGTLGTYNFEAIAVGAGDGVLQLRSISGINFRAHLSV
ncbi:MAG: hypothetical protein PHF21_04355, partial [Bacilli bacterium]|nr:hypothetical protein [Bacilli bacterium]